jgi:hypothetical protein
MLVVKTIGKFSTCKSIKPSTKDKLVVISLDF